MAIYREDDPASGADHGFRAPTSESEAIDSAVEAAEVKGGDGTGGEHRLEAAGTGSRQIGRRFVFGAVEHFVNTKDYVGLIGESRLKVLFRLF